MLLAGNCFLVGIVKAATQPAPLPFPKRLVKKVIYRELRETKRESNANFLYIIQKNEEFLFVYEKTKVSLIRLICCCDFFSGLPKGEGVGGGV